MKQTEDRNPLILIAEDNLSNYMLLEVLLKRKYRLVRANNGREAVLYFKEYHPQMILMDIKMPVMDGYEATMIIRQLSSSIPIVAITAHAFLEDQERILASGFNAYLAKPVNLYELEQKIVELLDASCSGI